MERRHFLAAVTCVIGGIAGCGSALSGRTTPPDSPTHDESTPSPTPDTATRTSTPAALPSSVGLETLVSGLGVPLDVAFPPDSSLVYLAEQGGRIHVLEGGELRSNPLLDLRDTVATGYEMGLLGITLHPDFADNRRLFVRYSAPPREGTPPEFSHTFVLSEFRVTEDGSDVRPNSERTILTIPEPQANHNAGSIVFGPDGYLYVGVGDGGNQGDQGLGHVTDWYDAVPGGNGQDVTENLLGSILRIDVDRPGDGSPYAIPDDNPLVGKQGLDEQFAWGFRNPWRLSFDGTDLYAGDVGQSRFEEVDLVQKGGNYGWNVREGTHCYEADTCPESTPPDVRDGEPLLPPIIEYPHSDGAVSGISVIIGNVYRGSGLPGLRGHFVFGDLNAEGELFVATPRNNGLWPVQPLPIADADAGKLSQIFSFKRHDGDMYVLGSGSNGGGLHRLQPDS